MIEAEASRGGLFMAARQVGGASEIVAARCDAVSGTTESMSCNDVVHSPIDALAAEPSVAIAAYDAGLGAVATEELTAIPGEVRLSLHMVGAGDEVLEHGALLFDSTNARAPLRDVLALTLEGNNQDMTWAAIVEVERDGSLRDELWTGAWRICLGSIGP